MKPHETIPMLARRLGRPLIEVMRVAGLMKLPSVPGKNIVKLPSLADRLSWKRRRDERRAQLNRILKESPGASKAALIKAGHRNLIAWFHSNDPEFLTRIPRAPRMLVRNGKLITAEQWDAQRAQHVIKNGAAARALLLQRSRRVTLRSLLLILDPKRTLQFGQNHRLHLTAKALTNLVETREEYSQRMAA